MDFHQNYKFLWWGIIFETAVGCTGTYFVINIHLYDVHVRFVTTTPTHIWSSILLYLQTTKVGCHSTSDDLSSSSNSRHRSDLISTQEFCCCAKCAGWYFSNVKHGDLRQTDRRTNRVTASNIGQKVMAYTYRRSKSLYTAQAWLKEYDAELIYTGQSSNQTLFKPAFNTNFLI